MEVENGVLLNVEGSDIIFGKFNFPEGVTSIGDSAFFYCRSLTQIKIPEGVTSIGIGAFYRCDSLTQIEIPKSVTNIGNNAFYYCNNLNKIKYGENILELPNNVTNILLNKYGLIVLTEEGVNVLSPILVTPFGIST